MLAHQEPLGQHADRQAGAGRARLDDQQRLMLLRSQAGLGGGLFAESEEFAQGITEIGQRYVIHPSVLQHRSFPFRFLYRRTTQIFSTPTWQTTMTQSPTPARANEPGDFTADRRVLFLMALAVIVGSAAVVTAWILLKLIALCTDLAYFGRFTTEPL